MKTLSVQVQPDHLERLARGRKPVLALAELIWNALDADATDISVVLERDLVGGISEIRVVDDGTGITPSDIDGGFASLGGSWKRLNTRTRGEKRILHGKEGKGRFQAFTLGSEVSWRSCYSVHGELKEISISATIERLGTFIVSDPQPGRCVASGTEVVITGVPEAMLSLASPEAAEELAEIFAFYLRQYPSVQIRVDGKRVDPSSLEVNVAQYLLPAVTCNNLKLADVSLTVIEWRAAASRSLYLCDSEGFALHALTVGIQAPGFNFTAYLQAAYFRELHDSNELIVGDLNPCVLALHEAAKEQLRDHFRKRTAERAVEVVDNWKRENIYPYEGEPKSIIERTERQVFDVIAYNVNSYLPDFSSNDRRSQKLSLRLLKQAIESNPDAMHRILSDVLDLPKQRQDELAELLNKTSLSAIIAASKVVADRLNFVRALEVLVYDEDSKRELLERTQLHRILADHTWIFGEEFNLSVDDQSLTEVLHKHIQILGRTDLSGEPVKRADGKVGIVDLMLSRIIPQPKAEEREHLVIELKRPSQKIDRDVVGQITDYALAVARDERFRDTNTRWVFWAVSNDMDDYARFQTRQKGRPRGLLLEHEEMKITIWAKPWSEIIQDTRGRLTFFQKQLDYTADRESGLAYLRKTHEKYFPPSLL